MSKINLLKWVLVALCVANHARATVLPTTNNVLSLVGGLGVAAPPKIDSAWQKGAVTAPDTPFTFTMALNSANMPGLESKMLEISKSHDRPDGGLPWLTENELAVFATPATASLDAVHTFLEAAGIPAHHVKFSKFKDRVTVLSTVGQVSTLFGANFFDYSLNGQKSVPRTLTYTIPTSLRQSVNTVSPLNVFMNVRSLTRYANPISAEQAATFAQQSRAGSVPAGMHVSPLHAVKRQHMAIQRADRTMHRRHPAGTTDDAAPASCNEDGVTPACLRNLYGTMDYKPKPNQGGEDVAVMGYIDQSVSQADLTKFLQLYRPEAAEMQLEIRSTHSAVNIEQNPGTESMLDVETVVSAIWPLKAAYQDVGTYLTQGDVFQIATQDFIDNFDDTNRPRVVTTSYGADEPGMTADQAALFCDSATKLAALGTTSVYSSGDNGVAGTQGPPEGTDLCPPYTPTYPSGCPAVLSVGALEGFAPERAVSKDKGGYYGGSGFSNYFKAPEWQKEAIQGYFSRGVAPASAGMYDPAGRAYPDVSAQGVAYAIVVNGMNVTVSGTSASGPTVASVLAILNDARRQKGLGTVGWINPALYRKGNDNGFNDVDQGGSYGCSDTTQEFDGHTAQDSILHSKGFPAAQSWDASAGWGSPDFASLRQRFGA